MYLFSQQFSQQQQDALAPTIGLRGQSGEQLLQAGIGGFVCGAAVIEAAADLLMVAKAQRFLQTAESSRVHRNGGRKAGSGNEIAGSLQLLNRFLFFCGEGAKERGSFGVFGCS